MKQTREITPWAHSGILLGVGAAGAWLGTILRIPAGTLLGAMILSGVYFCLGGKTGPGREPLGRIGRVLLGSVIGAAFTPDVLQPLRNALLPVLLLISVMVVAGLFFGLLLCRLTKLDPATALLSSVPGGLPIMVAMGEELGCDTAIVAAVHFFRLTTILLATPILMPLLAVGAPIRPALAPLSAPIGPLGMVVALAVGALGGKVALRLRVPTGDLMGSMILVGIVSLAGVHVGPLPDTFMWIAQLLIGLTVGTQISRESLRRLREAALPAAAVTVFLISAGLLLGWFLWLATSLDLATSLLSAVPGGAATMPAIAHDLGGDMRLVAALHTTRQVILALLLTPTLKLLLRRQAREPKPAASHSH